MVEKRLDNYGQMAPCKIFSAKAPKHNNKDTRFEG